MAGLINKKQRLVRMTRLIKKKISSRVGGCPKRDPEPLWLSIYRRYLEVSSAY
jgi:hypothetical protein